MGVLNNIFNTKIQFFEESCYINSGNGINLGLGSDGKFIGGSYYIGDVGRCIEFGLNFHLDPDLIDSPQIGLF